MVLTARQLADLMPDTSQLESDEPEMESSLHAAQLMMLVACLERLWLDRSDYFIGANLTIYFSRAELKNRDFRGPDFFLVKNTTKQPRKSWVVWEEGGKYPDLIIELLSDSTANVDRNLKKNLYQDYFRTPEYFWFSPESLEFMGYRLVQGQYLEIPANAAGYRWSESLELYLGVLEGKLRYFSSAGELIPTPLEAEVLAEQQLEQERLLRKLAEDRAEALAQRLRDLGLE